MDVDISSFFDILVVHEVPAARPVLRPLAQSSMSDAGARELETVFKALADRHRLKILNRLLAAGGEAVCACDFEGMLDLKQLLDAGIVEREKRGSFAFFSIAEGALERVCGLLGYEAMA